MITKIPRETFELVIKYNSFKLDGYWDRIYLSIREFKNR